ncbi:MAG: transglycosylase domain-containing protein [Hyphomicrobiaceae bacterium]
MKETSNSKAAPAGKVKRRHASFSLKLKLLVLGPIVVSLLCVAFLSVVFLYFTLVLPSPLTVEQRQGAPVVRILARDGSVLAERGSGRGYVPLDLMPRQLVEAVVATEDRRFFQHWGLDPRGLLRAFFTNLRAGRYMQGGSTITQQLAKNLFLHSNRTLGRKIDELLLALWLELRLSKRDILEVYLNRVYFGSGAYGVESAARTYFGKPATKLTLAESALLAGMLKAPSRYSPSAKPGLARARARVVLANMHAAGFISKPQLRTALAFSLRFRMEEQQKKERGLEYAVDHVLESLPDLVLPRHGRISVETTIDADLQRLAQAAITRSLERDAARFKAGQAALVMLDRDGAVRVIVGGRSYKTSQFNRASKARRQPGSAFKPIVYLTAVETGLLPDSEVKDIPVVVDGWMPRNTSGQYRGSMTLRDALSGSVNSVAVRLLLESGIAKVKETARRLGIHSTLGSDASIALGTSEVTLLELTSAYVPFANGGYARQPYVVRRVVSEDGTVLFKRRGKDQPGGRSAQADEPVVSRKHIGAMNDMLNAVVVQGTGRGAVIPLHPVGGKTGTSQDYRDAWFIGYSARFVTGVWLGNDDARPMRQVTGGGLPTRIWREVMLTAHRGLRPIALPGTIVWQPASPPLVVGEAGDRVKPRMLEAAGGPVAPARGSGWGLDFLARLFGK